MEDIKIRIEEEKDYRIVEEVTREAFWNVYKAGCDEHFILHRFRESNEFIKELSLILEKDNMIIGHIMYAKAYIIDKIKTPILTFGPISILPEYQRKGYGKILIDYSIQKAIKLGYGAICITGDINYYKKFNFVIASTKNIYYHNMSKEEPCEFLLIKELKNNFLKNINGRFYESNGYFVNKEEVEEFDKNYPYKEKIKTDKQIFSF